MISVVIPAFNEAGAIGPTLEALAATLRQADMNDFELLVVDDGSTDDTADIARSHGATVVSHPHNVGYGRSLKKGIRAARFDTICIIDADLTYPAEAIPGLVEEYERGFDLVVGARQGHHYSGSAVKGPMRVVLRLLVEFAASREVTDANSGLRVFSKQTVLPHLNQLSDVFSFTTSQTLAYMMTGLFVSYVPVEYHERIGTTKVRLLKDSFRTLLFICRAIMYYNPLKIFVLFSVFCFIGALAGFALAALTGVNAPYFLGIGALLMSVLMFGLGLVAELLRQILIK